MCGEVDMETYPQDILMFADTERVQWGRPGITEQTQDESCVRVFVYQSNDGSPVAVLRLLGATIVDVAIVRPHPFPTWLVLPLIERAQEEGATEIQHSALEPLRDLCVGLGLRCLPPE